MALPNDRSMDEDSDYIPNGEITAERSGYIEDIKPSCSSHMDLDSLVEDVASVKERFDIPNNNAALLDSTKSKGGQKRKRTLSIDNLVPLEPETVDPTTVDANFENEWNIFEKKRLLRALEEHGPDDISVLQAAVGTKSKNQVVSYMTSLMESTPLTVKIGGDHPFCDSDSYSAENSELMKNIEKWLDIAKIHMGDRSDFSYVLGDVFVQIAEQLKDSEEEQIVTVSEKKFAFNYARIYSYLGAILRGCRQAPILNPLECFVLLDMLKELAEEVKNLPDEPDRSAYLSKLMKSHADQNLTAVAPQIATLNSKPAGGAVSIDLTSLNPLCIPVKLLRVVPKKPAANGD